MQENRGFHILTKTLAQSTDENVKEKADQVLLLNTIQISVDHIVSRRVKIQTGI